MNTLPLDGAWTVTALSGEAPPELIGRDIAATVPGCVHLDLLAAEVIDEPFDGDNEAAQQWIGSTVWRFTRTFTWTPSGQDRDDLLAHGLDTLATVTLNGTVIAQTENQNRSFRWTIGHLLREGENVLEITFDTPVPAVERRERENGGRRFHVNHHPYNAIRKTASNFGWDWGIDVATSGIWRSIEIQSWSGVRLAEVRPLVDVAGTAGILTAHLELEQYELPIPREVSLAVGRNGTEINRTTAQVTTSGALTITVPDVELWWPRGHGAQPRYDVTITVDGETWEHKIGFRTVELDTQPDADGTPFQFIVNGRKIHIYGANWIPDDAFVTRIDTARLERRIKDATEANMNLLRIWGGGMYESEEFYEICAREGVMVWQDFLLACGAYAEEEWLAIEIEAEARENIARLSKHASLVLWCGNNENLVGFADWGWRADLQGRTWGAGYYFELFPRMLADLDPTRPYIPGSPFSASNLLDPNKDTDGTVHIWDVWNEKDYTSYREWRPRFCAEFGFQGPAAWSTLFDVVHDSPLDPNGHELLVHQKANNGNLKLERGYAGHFPEPQTIDDWHFITQLNQAHALRFGIGWFRSLAPYNTGTVIWQLNDDWPVVSWAAVDYAERRKPLWYAMRDIYAPRFATVQPAEGGMELFLHNDTDEALDGEALLRRIDFSGAELASQTVQIAVDARGVARFAVTADVARAGDARSELLVVTFAATDGSAVEGLARIVHDFAEVVDQALDPRAATAAAESVPDGAIITVKAHSYLRDVVVLADRADTSASVDASVVSLLPGETATFRITADGPVTAFAALASQVLRSANQLHGEPVGELLASAAE